MIDGVRSSWVLLLAGVACNGARLEITARSDAGESAHDGERTALCPERHPAEPCPRGGCRPLQVEADASTGPVLDAALDGVAPDEDAADAAEEDTGGPVVVVPAARRALIISVDGLGAVYLEQQLALGQLPNFARLTRLGASTLEARTDVTHTITLPNHTSMLTGRPVWEVEGAPPGTHHGYTQNSLPPADQTLHNAGNPALAYVPSLFDVAHDHGLTTCVYAGKPKFVIYAQSYDEANGAPDVVGADNGRRKLDHFTVIEDATLADTAAADLAAGRCDVTLLHIPDLDTPIGHSYGWGSEDWLQALARVDAWLGTLCSRLFLDKRNDEWALILTADHGGMGTNHSTPTEPSIYRIPFIVVAPGVPRNTDLYRLVADTRVPPGTGQPSYADPDQPIRNGDAANVALELIGLPPIAGSLMSGIGLRD